MNEKFMELADQLKWESDVSYGELMRYAELIVRECAGLVQGVPTDTMGYHTADQKIKQHFGVK